MRLMPCMYFTHWLLGRFGSGLRRYKYSANCFNTPIKKLYLKIQFIPKKVELLFKITVPVCNGTNRLFYKGYVSKRSLAIQCPGWHLSLLFFSAGLLFYQAILLPGLLKNRNERIICQKMFSWFLNVELDNWTLITAKS
jgi:hypothetical protein